MASERQQKMSEVIRQHIAHFIEMESTNQSLITITRVNLSPDFKNATVFFTTLPQNQEHTALAFLQRKRKDIREHLKKHLRTRTLPFIDVQIDAGERNRQKIDELLFKDKKGL